MARFDLTDFEWSVIQPLLPNKPRGVPRVDDRRVLNGIFWRLRTGAPWADIPERYGPLHDLREPLQPLAQGGRLGSAFGGGIKGLRRRHPDDRFLQHPRASARRQHPKKDDRSRCMGRSRGGLTTKIHALVDACGLPIALKLTEGQAHDGRAAVDMLGLARARRHPARRCAPTIPMPCAKTWRRAAPGPTSSPCPIAAACRPSRHSSIATATWSSASSTNSSIFERSRPATTRHQKTSSQPSSLPQQEFGCGIMSLWPRLGASAGTTLLSFCQASHMVGYYMSRYRQPRALPSWEKHCPHLFKTPRPI